MKIEIFTQFSKWRSVFLLFALLFLWQLPYGQAADNLSAEKMQLEEAFFHIGKEYGVFFNYDREIVADVTVEYESGKYEKVEAALQAVFRQTHLQYQIFDQRFVAVYQDSEKGIQSMKDMISHFQGIVDEKENVSNRSMMIVSPLSRQSLKDIYQKRIVFSVNGTVTDEEGEPLIGVNIQVKGSSKGTSTDFDGNFTLEDIDENALLVVSYVGYQTQEVVVAGKSNLEIVMISDSQLLEEVVVIGYGTQKIENVIGSVSTIRSEDIASSPVSNVSNALAGRLPGATIQQRSGEPGEDGSSINIRGITTLGNAAPLVVVDGIPGRDLNSLNSNDIESITILKDASAAIYGSRAANGVILVTTKRGSKDSKTSLTYSYNRGLQSPTVLPEMADAATYAQMMRENQLYRGVDESNMSFSLEDIEKYKSGEYPWTHPNTDWFDAALAKTSVRERHDLSVSGGGQSVSYFGSFGKEFSDGIYKNSASSYNRYNLNANVDVSVTANFRFGVDINASQENRLSPTKSTTDIYGSILRNYPTTSAVWPNGLPGPDIEYGDNPVVTPSFETGFDDDKRYRSNNKLFATFDIPGIEGLALSGYYAYDIYFQKEKLFAQPWILYDLDRDAYLKAGNTGKEDGSEFLNGTEKAYSEPRLTDSYSNSTTKNLNVSLNFKRVFNDIHDINVFAAYENSDFKSEGISAFRRYFISTELPYLFAGGSAEKDNEGIVSIDARENYFGRIEYNLLEKYLFQFSFRRDGSLNFSKESGRWGNFPAFLVGWRISNEPFWQNNIRFFNDFKLKASWGKLGNDLVDPFQYLTGYSFGGGGVFGDGKVYSSGLFESVTPNPFITWEVANIVNGGFETNFLNKKVYLNTDFFYQRRKDILIKRNASVPEFTGLTLPDENFGIVDSRGFEIILGYNNDNSDFRYGLEANASYAKNEIIEFDEPARNVEWQVRTGHPIGAELLYKSIGIFRDEAHVESLPHVSGAKPGDIIIEDYNGDGKITNDDRILFDNTDLPKWNFGVQVKLGYKNWGFSALVQGVGAGMRRMYNDDRQGSGGNYFQYDAEGRWTPDNIDAEKPRAFERLEEYWRNAYLTDYSFANTAYMRLKNAQIYYNLPGNLQQKFGLSNTQISLSGQNLFFLYNKSPITDPELIEDRAYPIMRAISLGVRVGI